LIYADLHIHTIYSADSVIQPKTLVDHLVAHRFVKVAAVTDHDSVRGCKATIQLASPYPDILIIPGVEISTAHGDMIILGTDELPPTPWNPQALADHAKSIGAVSIVAHPYREYGMGDLARNYKIDAVEVLNGGSTQSANKQARELARILGLPGTAGSDAHRAIELLSVYTQVQASLDIDDILKAIRNGKVTAASSERSIHF
jgi:predicted metal-dependent phosphoesterase TrpH